MCSCGAFRFKASDPKCGICMRFDAMQREREQLLRERDELRARLMNVAETWERAEQDDG